VTRQDHTEFVGSVPAHYDRYLGPVLFEPYARDLVSRLPSPITGRVLELACGTGILTGCIAEALAGDATLVATDLNDAMLAHARERVASPRVTWRPADMQALPLDDGAFDVAVCQFGIMFVPDKRVALREARRVLADGGRFVFSTWGRFDENPLQRIAHEVIAGFYPLDPPSFYLTPFGFHDRDELAALTAGAGFRPVTIDDVALESRANSAADLALGLVDGNPVANVIRERNTVPIERVRGAVAAAVRAELGDGPVRVPMRARIVDAVAA
jgi:SAM-dependent methyltransferase